MTSNIKDNKPYINKNIRPGDFIVATKWIGIEGAIEIINHNMECYKRNRRKYAAIPFAHAGKIIYNFTKAL